MSADDDWVIVPVLQRSDDVAASTAAIHARLSGIPVLGPAEAGAAFERVHSADPTPIDANVVERWASRSRAALRHLSRGDYEAAREALLEAQAISDRAAVALNRETVRARQVLDTCLFVVRTSLETGDVAGAEEQARRCRRLVPRMQASAYTHTPEVRELVARIDAALEAEVAGLLTVESTPAGCNVRINGVYFGPTPLATSELPRGDYRVQVECDEAFAGRIHRVTLGETDASIRVTSALERALRSRPSLALVYDDPSSLAARAGEDGAELARLLQRRVLLVQATSDRWSALAIDARGRREAPLTLPATDEVDSQARLARYLGTTDAREAPPSDPTRPRVSSPASLTLLSLGVAALGAGAGMLALRDARGDDYHALQPSDRGYLGSQTAYLRLRPIQLTSSITGALATSVGASMLVRRARHPSAIAWTFGALGLGLGALATFDAMRAPICFDVPLCTEGDARIDRAIVLGSLAAPALALPIAASTGREGADVAASLRLEPQLAILELRGALR